MTARISALRRAALDGRCATLRLTPEEREVAFFDGPVQLISPIGARLLLALYREGRIKLKKPAVAKLPALEAYIATEAAFLAEVAQLLAEEDAKRDRLACIVADPSCARADELSPFLIDKVITAKLGYGALGQMQIAGLMCHKELADAAGPSRDGDQIRCWWLDAQGHRHGDL